VGGTGAITHRSVLMRSFAVVQTPNDPPVPDGWSTNWVSSIFLGQKTWQQFRNIKRRAPYKTMG